MKRRDFMALAGGAAAVWPLGALAQTPERVKRIGILFGVNGNDPEGQRWLKRFIQVLRELGWRNGVNVQMDLRWAPDIDRMRKSAQELIALKPDVIHVTTSLATAEVLRETTTIPVVFDVVNDPLALGLVKDAKHPGGNATGFTNIVPDLGAQWLKLLKEMAPRVTHATVMYNPVPGSQLANRWAQFEAVGGELGIKVEAAPVRELAEIEKTLRGTGVDPDKGLIVIPDTFFNLARSGLIISLISRQRIVAIYPFRDFVVAGGLASYAVDIPELQRRSAVYVDRILRGEKPGNLPVEGPNKFELVINQRAAKLIDLVIPKTVLARATEVLE